MADFTHAQRNRECLTNNNFLVYNGSLSTGLIHLCQIDECD